MTILVTGGAGLIGMALRPALAARGYTVAATDITDFGRGDPSLTLMPLSDRDGLERLIADGGIEAILHCGAISGPMLAKGEPLTIVEANIDGTALLLDLARRRDIRRFVFCSSISVYGDVGQATITEATPLEPSSVYGASKVACEQLVRGFAAEYGLDGVSLRIARVYGPYRRANCQIGAMIRDAAAGRATEIPCDPDFVYHYVYVDDVAEAIISALEGPALPHREYNVGTGEPHTMPEIAAIARETIPGVQPVLVPGADDVPDVQVAFDVTRIEKDLGWRARFGIADGISACRRHIESGDASPAPEAIEPGPQPA